MFTHEHIRELETGHAYFGGFSGGVIANGGRSLVPGTTAWIEAGGAWDFLRQQLLHDWIRKEPNVSGHGGPGTRPWCWWHLDKRERRRRIDGKPHPFDNPERIAIAAKRTAEHPTFARECLKLYYGCPGCLMVPDDFAAVYESEAAYLERLKLWLPDEREMFEAKHGALP